MNDEKSVEVINESFVIEVDRDDALEKWNYDKTVKACRPKFWKAHMMTAEMRAQVWLAHEALAKEGNPHRTVTNDTVKTFSDWCDDVGIARMTGYRWYKKCRYGRQGGQAGEPAQGVAVDRARSARGGAARRNPHPLTRGRARDTLHTVDASDVA